MNKELKDFLFLMLLAVIAALLLHLFSPREAKGQEPPTVHVGFENGLQTKVNPLNQKGFTKLHNFLLNEEYGSLVLRPGDLARTDSLARTIASPITWTAYLSSIDTTGGQFVRFGCLIDQADYPLRPEGFWDGDTVHILEGSTVQTHADSIWVFDNYYINIYDSSYFVLYGAFGSYPPAAFTVGDSIALRMQVSEYPNQLDTGGITGLFSFYKKPRSKHLLQIIPGFGAQNQWSSLYASVSNGYDAKIKLADYVYKGETPQWATWNGRTYVALPRQRPLVTDVGHTTELVPRAPGQIEIMPFPVIDVDTVTFKVNGSVKYTLYSRRYFTGAVNTALDSIKDSLNDRPGYVSYEVPLFNERSLLRGFPRPAQDSIQAATAGNDSVLIYIAKSRGYAQAPRPVTDSFFLIGSIISASPAILDTFTFIDSIPDDSLGSVTYPFAGSSRGVVPADSSYVNAQTEIHDTVWSDLARSNTAFYAYTAPGAPTFVADTLGTSATDFWPTDTNGTGLEDHLGWQYTVMTLDTLFGITSDTSPNLILSTPKPVGTTGGQDSTRVIVLGVPPLADNDTGRIRIVMRAEIKKTIIPDSFVLAGDAKIEIGNIFLPDYQNQYQIGDGTVVSTKKVPARRIEISAFFPVGILYNQGDTLFNDDIDWDTWAKGGVDTGRVIRDRRWDPKDNRMDIVTYFHPFKDNLFAVGDNGSRLFRSVLDTPIFRPFNDILFDPENGDRITAVADVGPNIIVFWSDGLVELYDPNATLPTKGAPVEGFGCVATGSLINYGGVAYFLAKDGIRAITTHPVKTYGVQNNVISWEINDQIIDGRSDSLRSTMVGAYDPESHAFVWCYPSIDTMWMYFPPVGNQKAKWATRDGSFFQATLYDTTSIEGIMKSSALVYAKTGDERVFEMHGSPTYFDSGLANTVVGVFETAPQFTDYNWWSINYIGLMRGMGAKNATLALIDQTGTSIATESIANDSLLSVRGITTNLGQWISIRYTEGSVQPTISDTIRGLDIWAVPRSRPTLK